jgi:hypothetical protein
MMTDKKNNISVSIASFSENTKSVFILTSISLFLIIITSLLSHIYTNNLLNKGIKIIAVLTLLYALYINVKETNKLYNNVPTMFSNSELQGLRNNTLLSYGLSLMIFGLSNYIIFTL